MWKDKYKKSGFYWGLKPNPLLKKYLEKVPKGKALDIGAGEGRNSFFLAQNGFEVTAIDKEQEGLEKIEKIAKENNLPVEIKLGDIKDFGFKENYSLIVSFAAIDFLKKSEIDIILDKIKKSLKPKGFIFLLVFSNKDLMFKSIKEKNIKEIEENTFYLPKFNTYRHFFTKQELEEKFKEFDVVLSEEKEILDNGHEEIPHYHNIIEIVAQK